ncbi:unnamed protein product, partial [Scytosiphon promiscuus]
LARVTPSQRRANTLHDDRGKGSSSAPPCGDCHCRRRRTFCRSLRRHRWSSVRDVVGALPVLLRLLRASAHFMEGQLSPTTSTTTTTTTTAGTRRAADAATLPSVPLQPRLGVPARAVVVVGGGSGGGGDAPRVSVAARTATAIASGATAAAAAAAHRLRGLVGVAGAAGARLGPLFLPSWGRPVPIPPCRRSGGATGPPEPARRKRRRRASAGSAGITT